MLLLQSAECGPKWAIFPRTSMGEDVALEGFGAAQRLVANVAGRHRGWDSGGSGLWAATAHTTTQIIEWSRLTHF